MAVATRFLLLLSCLVHSINLSFEILKGCLFVFSDESLVEVIDASKHIRSAGPSKRVLSDDEGIT